MIRPDGCTCPRWVPHAMQWDADGWTPTDYGCTDESCRCPVHCWDEDEDRPKGWGDE